MTPRPLARALAVTITLSILLTLTLIAAVATGAEPIDLSRAWRGVPPDRDIVVALRLPRALLGALVGACLASAGLALQALLRNPLADPFVLGVSGGAALGATLFAALGTVLGVASTAGFSPVAVAAFAGALAAALGVYALGRVGGRLVPERALLVGVVFNAFASAVITGIKISVSPSRAQTLLSWLVGSLGYERPTALLVAAAFSAAGIFTMMILAGRMNLLALGEEGAAAVGVDVPRTRGALFLAASLVTGAAVSLAGLVGFVGLLVPHAARLILGPDHRSLVPACALGGAAALVLADTGARLLFRSLGTEPPVGVVTALLGGPLFLWLLARQQEKT